MPLETLASVLITFYHASGNTSQWYLTMTIITMIDTKSCYYITDACT